MEDKIKVTNSNTGEIIKGDKFAVSKYLKQEGFKLTDKCMYIEKLDSDK